MIIAGIMQYRQTQLNSDNYYLKAQAVFGKFNLLPVEAKKGPKNPNGLDVPKPPSAGDKATVMPEVQIKARQYVEQWDWQIESAIPVYVYAFFEAGKKAKFGY
jgi:hypothetical protein